MVRKNERIEALMERYYEAQTTAAEERELRAFFAAGEVPAEMHDVEAMFRGFDTLAAETSLRRFGQTRRRHLMWRLGGMAAAAAVAVGVFVLGGYLNRPYCYIDGVAVRDARTAMQATAYFERLSDMDKPFEALDNMLNQTKKEEESR